MGNERTMAGLRYVGCQAAGALVHLVARTIRRDDWAERWTSWARERHPSFDANFVVSLAEYYEKRGMCEKAEVTIRDGIMRTPEDGFLFAMLGLLLDRQGRTAETIECLDAALARDIGGSVVYREALRRRLAELRAG